MPSEDKENSSKSGPAPRVPARLLRPLMLSAVGLAVAAGGPIGMFAAKNYWTQWRSSASAMFAPGTPAEAAPGAGSPPAGLEAAAKLPRLEGEAVDDLARVFRFDITPGWVIQHWPRVSTGLADLRLEGYRVPLVTGTEAADLAGALTYYFDPEQKVQRITFRGTTGDVRELARLLTERFQFARRLTNDPGLVVFERVGADGAVTGIARFRAADVIQAEQPLQRFQVELAIERAG